MKKKWLALLALCCVLPAGIFAACDSGNGSGGNGQGGGTEQGGGNEQGGGTEQGGESADKTITGVTFADKTVTYDGEEHEIVVSGTVPQGVTVAYSQNKGTNAGTYEATAVLSGEGYQTLTLEAELVINKADLDAKDYTFEDATVTYDGKAHSLKVEGTLPAGVTVAYTNNAKTEAGTYEVKAVLSGANYNALTLTAQLRILPDLSQLAQTIMDSFGSTPDVWEFLPESFRLDIDRAVSQERTLDFSNFVNKSAFPEKTIGKQLDVVYGTVINMQELMSHVNVVYSAAETIAGLYQAYINDHTDDYDVFDGSTAVGGVTLSFRIALSDTEYELLANVGTVAVELHAYPETERYTGRVEISASNALKFEVGPDSLKIGLNIADRACTMLEFVRQEGAVTGYLYESLDAEVTTFGTTAILMWNGEEDGTVAVAGENGDFMLGSTGRVVEMYSAQTGEYIAGKVYEEGFGEFNTYWFPLESVTGIDSVKAVKKSGIGGTVEGQISNPHDIYINGGSKEFAVAKTIPIVGSRKYDIEMKTVYYYTYDAAEEKFEKVKCELPMLFVQEAYLDTYPEDVSKENGGLTSSVTTTDAQIDVLDIYYEQLLLGDDTSEGPNGLYDQIAALVTPEGVVAFIGEKDAYFTKA